MGTIRSRDAELLSRVSRLERMLAAKNQTANNPAATLLANPGVDVGDGPLAAGISLNDYYANFVKEQETSSRHLDSEL